MLSRRTLIVLGVVGLLIIAGSLAFLMKALGEALVSRLLIGLSAPDMASLLAAVQ
jgi:hypothetical protein